VRVQPEFAQRVEVAEPTGEPLAQCTMRIFPLRIMAVCAVESITLRPRSVKCNILFTFKNIMGSLEVLILRALVFGNITGSSAIFNSFSPESP
jgi:hypothetical protein